jgi:hypothetical protein
LPFVKLKSAGNPHVLHNLKLEAIPARNIEMRLKETYLWIGIGGELL